MHFQDVPSFIRSFSTEKIKPSQLPEIVDVFREWNNAVAPALKLNHVKNILMRTGVHLDLSASESPLPFPLCASASLRE